MAHGGKRPGAGRKPKGEGEKTRETAIKLLAEGTTPLDYMVGVMRGTETFDETKFEAAKAAAPYMHARLAAVEAKVAHSFDDLDDAELDAEISRHAAAAGLAH